MGSQYHFLKQMHQGRSGNGYEKSQRSQERVSQERKVSMKSLGEMTWLSQREEHQQFAKWSPQRPQSALQCLRDSSVVSLWDSLVLSPKLKICLLQLLESPHG